jgi:hypothetical protein
MKTVPSTLVRPVRCQFCGEPMHYSGDVRHVPEVRVEIQGEKDCSSFYAHVTCWNPRMAPIGVKADEPKGL